jgi:hypothetical protein
VTGPRYEAVKVHMTAMQKRIHPGRAYRPWVVRDNATGRLVGLPDRYLSRSGAQARADREQQREDRS